MKKILAETPHPKNDEIVERIWKEMRLINRVARSQKVTSQLITPFRVDSAMRQELANMCKLIQKKFTKKYPEILYSYYLQSKITHPATFPKRNSGPN